MRMWASLLCFLVLGSVQTTTGRHAAQQHNGVTHQNSLRLMMISNELQGRQGAAVSQVLASHHKRKLKQIKKQAQRIKAKISQIHELKIKEKLMRVKAKKQAHELEMKEATKAMYFRKQAAEKLRRAQKHARQLQKKAKNALRRASKAKKTVQKIHLHLRHRHSASPGKTGSTRKKAKKKRKDMRPQIPSHKKGLHQIKKQAQRIKSKINKIHELKIKEKLMRVKAKKQAHELEMKEATKAMYFRKQAAEKLRRAQKHARQLQKKAKKALRRASKAKKTVEKIHLRHGPHLRGGSTSKSGQTNDCPGLPPNGCGYGDWVHAKGSHKLKGQGTKTAQELP